VPAIAFWCANTVARPREPDGDVERLRRGARVGVTRPTCQIWQPPLMLASRRPAGALTEL